MYPRGERILFSAFDRSDLGRDTPKQQLYTITTGLNHDEHGQNLPSGRIERFLDAKTYQNLRFNLSDNGKTLIVQRINHGNPDKRIIFYYLPTVKKRLSVKREG